MSISFDSNDLFYIESNLIGERVSLFDLAVWKNGLAFKNIDFSTTGKPVIKIAELNNGISNNTAYTDKEYSNDVSLTYGDLVFSWSGNPQTSIDIYKYILPNGWLNQHIFKVTPSSKVDKDFLFYVMKYLKPNFTKIATNKQTTGLGHVTLSDIKRISLILPTPYVQKQISAILSSIDNKIELNQQQNNNLEQQAQALFKSWFVDFEPFGGKMPDDWKVGKLDDLITFINGYAFKSTELENLPEKNKEYYDVFKQGHIKRGGGFNPEGTKSYYLKDNATNLDKYILKKGDILMAMTDMKGNVAILGNTALMNINNKYIVNQRVGLLRCNNNFNISYPYIYLLTNSSDFLTDLRNRANSGVQVNLSSSEIKASEVIIPDKEINDKFNLLGKAIFEKIFHNQQENTRLAQLRDTLLPKLMSGEIDVSKVNISADKLSFIEE